MTRQWTGEEVLELARAYQGACVLGAAAELDLFTPLAAGPKTAEALARRLGADVRATTILADALVAMGLLEKSGGSYVLAPGVADVLVEGAPASVLAMVRHTINCMRRWTQLARVARTGKPAERQPSVRGPAADLASFIEAMDVLCREKAPRLVAELGPPEFTHLLDVGGGPATWTIAFLRARPEATATIFDLPDVIPIARKHVELAGLTGRVTFAAGDFDTDPLPAGADLVWISAIVHQNAREENRALFAKARAALRPGGRLMVRDVVMAPDHVHPPAGAMFAVNMLAGTPGGGTFSLDEFREDLEAAGFRDVSLVHPCDSMDAVVEARRP